MNFSERYSKIFQSLLPTPFSIAFILTILTFLTTILFTRPESSSVGNYSLELLGYWEKGLWENNLMVFAMQMMLMLVLGHVLALSPSVNNMIRLLVKRIQSTAHAAFIVTLFTILVSLFNWGLGLIFGAIFARKVAEHSKESKLKINYPIIGAAGYSGLMVWHGGLSGSSLIKVAEKGHLKNLMQGVIEDEQLKGLPDQIFFSETVFSEINIYCTVLVLLILPTFMYWVGRSLKSTDISFIDGQQIIHTSPSRSNLIGAEKIDHSRIIATFIGSIIILYAIYLAFYKPNTSQLSFITPNYINFLLLGLGIMLHKSFNNFLNAINQAIGGAAGILIQFPLYFGIMGIMKGSGIVNQLSDFFVSISSETSFPLFTLISAGIVNVFVPSGGGQWAIQGPIIVQASETLGVPLSKSIMALAYGDQLTNMLQPFWALPLLGITGLKAKEIVPYTVLLMLLGIIIYSSGLLFF